MSYIEEYTKFIFLEDKLEKADIIFLPGSEEGELAIRAAKLWKDGYAPIILPSGKYAKLTGKFTAHPQFQTEWEYFHHILREEGVVEEAIWKEDSASYTYENAQKSRALTDAEGLEVKTAILCCQAYHARRASLYYQVCFPEAKILVCPVITKGISRENWFLQEKGIRLVLNEVKHCGSQFEDIFLQNLEQKMR